MSDGSEPRAARKRAARTETWGSRPGRAKSAGQSDLRPPISRRVHYRVQLEFFLPCARMLDSRLISPRSSARRRACGRPIRRIYLSQLPCNRIYLRDRPEPWFEVEVRSCCAFRSPTAGGTFPDSCPRPPPNRAASWPAVRNHGCRQSRISLGEFGVRSRCRVVERGRF